MRHCRPLSAVSASVRPVRARLGGDVVLRCPQQSTGWVVPRDLHCLALDGPWGGAAQTATHGDCDRNEDRGDPAGDQRTVARTAAIPA